MSNEIFFSNLYRILTGKDLFALLAVVASLFVIVSVAFLFHWNKYGIGKSRVLIAEILYFTVSISLLTFASSFIILYILQ